MTGDDFPPTPDAARERIGALRLADYAATRNALGGAVSQLSPYVTHGFVTLPEVWAAAGSPPAAHKFVQELGWRAFFRHVWRHRGDAMLSSLHEGPRPDAAYARTLPADLLEGRTGVPVVDQAVRALYAHGWLHNHARLWLASYCVHLRKLHWRSGADWMVAHLLDGDLASNHLSWQWVAGTGSSKPYLFDAANVARYAPAAWHSTGSVVDQPYEALEALARSDASAPAGPPGPGLAVPATHAAPPFATQAPDPAQVAGRDLWIVHAWSLAAPPPGVTAVAVLDRDWHARWPWDRRRWQFVGTRLAALGVPVWWGSAGDIVQALAAARSREARHDPHAAALLAGAHLQEPRLFDEPAHACRSFSQWWKHTRLAAA